MYVCRRSVCVDSLPTWSGRVGSFAGLLCADVFVGSLGLAGTLGRGRLALVLGA